MSGPVTFSQTAGRQACSALEGGGQTCAAPEGRQSCNAPEECQACIIPEGASELKILKAEEDKTLAQCLAVRSAVFTVERGVPREIEVDEWDVPGGICDHFLVTYGGRAVGAFRCMRREGAVVKLQRFCFLKEYRRRGLGRRAVAFMEEYYRGRSFLQVEIDSKYEVHEFYEKCGYRKVSDIFEEAGIPHVRMTKTLRA